MAEQYVHTLIPLSEDFVPTAAQVQSFVRAMVEEGVIPSPQKRTMRTPTGETRTVTNPFTYATMFLEVSRHEVLDNVDSIEKTANQVADYEIEVSGQGRPIT